MTTHRCPSIAAEINELRTPVTYAEVGGDALTRGDHGQVMETQRERLIQAATLVGRWWACACCACPPPVSDEDIRALRVEAAAAGDELQVSICDVALHRPSVAASVEARIECERVIREART